MANNIQAITTLGQGSSDANAIAYDIVATKTAYIKDSKITDTIPSRMLIYWVLVEQQWMVHIFL